MVISGFGFTRQIKQFNKNKGSPMLKRIILSLVGVMVVLTSACNTVEGIGKDIKKGGEKIEKAAK